MIILINESATIVDLDQFRDRIIIPKSRKQEISDYLKEIDGGFECFVIERGMIQIDKREEFYHAAVELLVYGAYAENLIEPKYEVTPKTRTKLEHFRECYITLNSGWRSGSNDIYHLEKLMRLGVIDRLSRDEKRLVESLECSLGEGIEDVTRRVNANVKHSKNDERWSLYIKLLSRYKALGLELNMPSNKRAGAEAWLYNNCNSLLYYGLASVAPRAGLELPSLPAFQVDLEIQRDIERRGEYEKQLKEKAASQGINPEKAAIQIYISAMHHLHLLLDVG